MTRGSMLVNLCPVGYVLLIYVWWAVSCGSSLMGLCPVGMCRAVGGGLVSD